MKVLALTPPGNHDAVSAWAQLFLGIVALLLFIALPIVGAFALWSFTPTPLLVVIGIIVLATYLLRLQRQQPLK